MKSETLIAIIEDAFPGHPIPEVTLRQVTLSEEGIRREISDEEWEKAGRVDRNVPWMALSDQDLIDCKLGIAFLAEPEFSYYLGALLRFAVHHLDASIWTPEGDLVASIMFHLTDGGSAETAPDVEARRASLNLHQTDVVRKLLRYVVLHSDDYSSEASRALFQYWEKAKQD